MFIVENFNGQGYYATLAAISAMDSIEHARIVKDFLCTKNVNSLVWPAISPDLS